MVSMRQTSGAMKPPHSAAPLRVLFVCVGNSARSQMAEALLGVRGGGGYVPASAGTTPTGVHPLTVRALAELGIDWSRARSKGVADVLDRPWDAVVTVCDEAQEACPYIPGDQEQLHWRFDDPAAAAGTDEARMAVFRRVRDEIAAQIDAFLAGRSGAHP